MRALAVVLLLGLMALAACAHRDTKPLGDAVLISPKLTLVLPRPSTLGRTVDRAQLVTARYGDEIYVFEGHISATPERFLMVGLDSLGRRAMTITWTDADLSYEVAPWLPRQLQPENILADMVVMYWPEAAVRQALSGSAGVLQTAPRQRSVLYDGQEIIHVDYAPTADGSPWSGQLSYRHLVWNYQLDIQSAEAAP